MLTRKQKNIVFIFIVLPFFSLASNDPWEPGEIEPPPPASIDEFIIILWVVGVLFAAYFFYKRNLKIETK